MKNMFSKGAHPSEFGHRQTTMLMLGLFLLVSQCLFAQSRIIKGTVYDEHKDALIGASVILKGTSQGTITDIDGNFSVEASDKNTVLIVSYIGYDAQEINVGSQTFVKVQLKPSSLALEEVVVVGYGSQKKSELTAAISSVKSSDFVRGNVRDEGQLLKGKIANQLKARQRLKHYYSNTIDIDTAKMTSNNLDEEFMSKAIQVVEENISNEDFTSDELASQLCMSRSSLYLKMNSISGEPPANFIRRIRFNKACKLLLEGRYSISEISGMVGFGSSSYFSTSFKKYVGCLPSEYVKQHTK